MKLDRAQWSTLSRLVDEALDVPEPERKAWLARQASLAPELRAALIETLGAHERERSRSFSGELPAFEVADERLGATLAAGARIGPYRLARRLGRGGMGEVWLAEQSRPTGARRVALKLPSRPMSYGVMAERFARERDILARLAHPNIARLYDAGFTADGQAWLALEYVEGVPFTHSCDERRLPLGARVALFLQVLAGVQHAHDHQVLHRDLKPSNILVTADGNVKLLDFGIAKLVDDDGSAEETDITRMGGHAFTVDYAAPEQVTGGPLTPAVDVYALGVLLYELLTGARPYRLERGTLGEIGEAIAIVDPVPASEAAMTDAAIAARSTTAARLRRALAGDFDTIIEKALRKAPEERYASARSLADDLARHRAGLAVSARAGSIWYRATRLLARLSSPSAAPRSKR